MGQPESVFDDIDEEALARAIAEAEEDVRAGRMVEHEIVVDWMRRAVESLESGLPMPKPPIPDHW